MEVSDIKQDYENRIKLMMDVIYSKDARIRELEAMLNTNI